ncbi:protein of unknown function [Bradyrhizobium sp. ORS 285]|nr:hypothetical protein BRAO285_2000020 [Bradyrhizobium sp. ORS 285]SMX61710.1 protein of unknown function [Bradyrhizobium sp. ORS 285]
MAGITDIILKLSLAASFSGAAGSVGYYYSVYLPARDAQIDAERRLDRVRAEMGQKAAADRAEAERLASEQRQAEEKVAAQANYEACVNRAYGDYNFNWASNCKRIAETNRKKRASCTYPPSTCDSLYADRDAGPNCALPREIAASLNSDVERSKDRCVTLNKAGLQ